MKKYLEEEKKSLKKENKCFEEKDEWNQPLEEKNVVKQTKPLEQIDLLKQSKQNKQNMKPECKSARLVSNHPSQTIIYTQMSLEL